MKIPLPFALLLTALTVGACVPVRYNQKARLADESMMFDPDPLRAELHGKLLSSREAAIGGFDSGGAGGCGCN